MGRKPSTPLTLNCAWCEKPFKRHYGHLNQRFCSRACAKRKHEYDYSNRTFKCEECGIEKIQTIHAHKLQRFCSVKCARININRNRKQENRENGFWFNYREAKADLIHEIGACEKCGWKEIIEILELHHKDCDRKNNHRSNLALLCPNCHTIEHWKAGTGQFKNNLGR